MIRKVKKEDIAMLAPIYKELYDDADIGSFGALKVLYKRHLAEAQRLYRAKVIEFHTYGNESEFPQNWYGRIGFKKDKELIIMNANIQEVLQSLSSQKDINER